MLSVIDWKTDLDFTGVLAWLVVYTGLVAGLGSDFCTGLESALTEAVLVASGLLSTLFGNSLLHAAITAFNAGPNGQSNLSFLTLVW